MKVFLSWSGTRSHKVALVFREWLPSVIQDIVPYVSSEDIDKGARWSTDIAKELSDSQFGILCVTRENISAPWLTFEAGALSKQVEKSSVNPFLFDIKRSELDGPLLQFQSTIFEKEDLKKLVATLNKSCGDNGLSSERLDRAFEVWYPTLEKDLNQITDVDPSNEDVDSTSESHVSETQKILEEILELTRINQKLIRNPDSDVASSLEELSAKITSIRSRLDGISDFNPMRKIQRFHPMMLDEVMRNSLSIGNGYLGIKITLSLLRNELPWIYDAGIETINVLQSKKSVNEKSNAIGQFKHVVDFSFPHPIMRDFFDGNEEIAYFHRRIRSVVIEAMERNL